MARGTPMKTPENLARAQQMRADGKLQREIADEIGVAVQTVNSWLNDPHGSRSRARKESYGGICSQCGSATTGCNGRGPAAGPPETCASCFATRNERRDREIAKAYDAGCHVDDIAARFGLDPHNVYSAAQRGGARSRLSASGSAKERRARRRAAVDLAERGVSPAEIASRLGYKSPDSAKFAVYHERRKALSDMGAR